MNIPIIGPIVEAVGGVATQWLKNRGEVAVAKHERKLQQIKSDASWDEQAMINSQNSWKDEWLTILISIPLVGCFIPPTVPAIMEGFDTLSQMPTWYQYMISVVVAASFGVRSLIGLNVAKTASKKVEKTSG